MGVVYTDFQSCVDFLKSELKHDQADVRATAAMMQGFEVRVIVSYPTEVKSLRHFAWQFHPEEWRQYSNFQKVFDRTAVACKQALIAHDENFSLALTCWDPKCSSPPHHQCGSKCWIKVLEGVLCESHFNVVEGASPGLDLTGAFPDEPLETTVETVLDLTRTATLNKASVTFVAGLAVHSIENLSEQMSYSLHLYVPPRTGIFSYQHTAS